MNNAVFTQYVRALEPGRELPDTSACAALLGSLRRLLVSEMRKRALWHLPPTCLGVYGGTDWSREETLEELLAECYSFIFIRRFRSLKAQLKAKDSIDGLVVLNVRHFLHDTQKKHDPVGFRVYDVLRNAILRSIDQGMLHVLEGEPGVNNETALGFAPSQVQAHRKTKIADSRSLAGFVDSWSNGLLPDLVTARGGKLEEVLTRLRRSLAALYDQGIEAFRFKTVVDLLKNDVRRRWRAVWDQAEGDTVPDEDEGSAERPPRVRLVQPDASFEEKQSFERLVDCVAEALDHADENPRTRSYLEKLWLFQRHLCLDSPEPKPPSQRRVAELLEIPRYRLPELYEALGRMVDGCRQEVKS